METNARRSVSIFFKHYLLLPRDFAHCFKVNFIFVFLGFLLSSLHISIRVLMERRVLDSQRGSRENAVVTKPTTLCNYLRFEFFFTNSLIENFFFCFHNLNFIQELIYDRLVKFYCFHVMTNFHPSACARRRQKKSCEEAETNVTKSRTEILILIRCSVRMKEGKAKKN